MMDSCQETFCFSTTHLSHASNCSAKLCSCVWKLSWSDQKVWADVLQIMLSKQHQGDWLYQVMLKLLLSSTQRTAKGTFPLGVVSTAKGTFPLGVVSTFDIQSYFLQFLRNVVMRTSI
ncbi:hypothetical protein ACS0TY_023252 [Phlomoides rotata]